MNKAIVKKYFNITLGVFLLAASLQFFYYPNHLVSGGVSGLALIVGDFSPVSPGVFMNLSNVVLFILAYFTLGKRFVADSIYASFAFSIILLLLEKAFPHAVVTRDPILTVVFGAIVAGFGLALAFNEGASTGGTAIVAKIVNKYFHIDIGKSTIVVDGVVVVCGMVAFGINKGLYGLLACIIIGLLTDKFIEGFSSCKQMIIISKKSDEIQQYIMTKIGRGCTKVIGEGAYSKQDVDIIYVVVHRRQFIALKKGIKVMDPEAFITVSDAKEVLGEGFADLE